MLNRYNAFAWHLFASLTVAAFLASLVFLLWYPDQLALASGVTDIFKLLLLVDVVLGPICTLIIFNPNKKELKRDLIVIVLIQLSAMIYGLHTVYVARPVYIVFSIDRFDLVYANELTEQHLAKVKNTEYQSLPLFGPELIATHMPQDNKSRNEILFGFLAGGDDLSRMPQYYLPYQTQKTDVLRATRPLDELKKFNVNELATVNGLLAKYVDKGNIGYLPLKGKASDLTVVVNRTTGEVIEMSVLKPWM